MHPSTNIPGRRSALWVGLACASLALAAAAPAAAQSHFPSDSAIRAIVREAVELRGEAGVVIGLLEADGSRRIVVAGNEGFDGRTLFEIGSITKVFTGILLAEMAERGEVRLDQPVQELLPAGVRMPGRGRAITLVDLSTHSSGLPRMPNNFAPADWRNPYADYTAERLYAFLQSHTLEREPGERAEYSNVGVGLLGHVLSLRAGLSYDALVSERVLRPLQLASTTITIPDSLRARLAPGHDAAGRPASNWDLGALAGAGALRSSADDLLSLLAANLAAPTTTMLGRALRRTQAPHYWNGERSATGLGWGVATTRFDRRLLSHGGGTGGYRTWIGLDPDRRIGVVVLANQVVDVPVIGLHLLDARYPPTTAGLRRGFTWLALGLAGLLVAGVVAAWRRTGATRRRTLAVASATALGLALWLGLTHVAAAAGLLGFGTPPTMPILLAVTFVFSLGLAFSAFGRRLAAGLPLAVLVGVHAFRLPLELLMHRACTSGLMPVQMSYSGLNFDILTGFLAIVVALLLWRGKAGLAVVRTWNLLGTLLLANIIGIAFLSAPTPLRLFRNAPANTWVTGPPYVWLPAVMVAFAILGHVVLWRRLGAEGRRAPAALAQRIGEREAVAAGITT